MGFLECGKKCFIFLLNRQNFINEQFLYKKYKELWDHTKKDKVMKTL
jgi:hypothetical protein